MGPSGLLTQTFPRNHLRTRHPKWTSSKNRPVPTGKISAEIVVSTGLYPIKKYILKMSTTKKKRLINSLPETVTPSRPSNAISSRIAHGILPSWIPSLTLSIFDWDRKLYFTRTNKVSCMLPCEQDNPRRSEFNWWNHYERQNNNRFVCTGPPWGASSTPKSLLCWVDTALPYCFIDSSQIWEIH